jgi:DNA-binding LacI/PurR family transcriptional regulator
MGRQAAEMMLAKITTGQPQPSWVFPGSIIQGKTAVALQPRRRALAKALRA